MPDDDIITGPFDKLGKFTEWNGHYAIYGREGKLLCTQDGVTRAGCREMYHSEPPLSADIIIVNGVQKRILDGSHATDN